MTNADKFKSLFGLYATELWAMPEKDFLKWLNSEAMNCSEFPNNSDTISRQAAIDALWKALYEYEDKTEKQFQESEDLDVGDWIEHRIFVQNMNDIDRQTILNLPSAEPKHGTWIPVTNGRGGHECDQCHNYAPSYQNGKEHLSDFCPHCGADMRTEETDCDYERAVEQLEHDMLYEPTFDPDDGSM